MIQLKCGWLGNVSKHEWIMVWFGTQSPEDSIMFGLELLAGPNELWFGLELWEQCMGQLCLVWN